MNPSPLAAFAYEGAFASPPLAQNLELRGPFASVLAGPGAPVSNTPGTIQSRFGWYNPATRLVNNTRESPQDAPGVVIPYRSVNGVNGGVTGGSRGAGPQSAWTWEYWDSTILPVGALRVRPGLGVTLHARGNFWLRFAGGALYGDKVYASLADGQAISGPASNAELTPFVVCSQSGPGTLAIVSSTAFFTPP